MKLKLWYTLNKYWIVDLAVFLFGIIWCVVVAMYTYTACQVIDANLELSSQNDAYRQRIAAGEDKASELIQRNKRIICAK